MRYFEQYFDSVDFAKGGQVKVPCPFHDDTHPSATINVNESLFYCPVCMQGHNEVQFAARVLNVSITEAGKLVHTAETVPNFWTYNEQAALWANTNFLAKVEALGLSRETIETLKLGLTKDGSNRPYLAFPVFLNKVLVDVREYNLAKYPSTPKMKSRQGAEVGYIVPHDVWIKDESNVTYILEGEKDMALARDLGLNAITFTGGAGAKPNKYALSALKDKHVILCYDNDKAGREGMKQVHSILKSVASEIQYIDISEGVKEEKEDFYDYIKKYGNTVWDFMSLKVHDFPTEPVEEKLKLKVAFSNNMVKQQLESIVTVTAEFSDMYAVPTLATAIKEEIVSDKDEWSLMQKATWVLEETNFHQMLELIETEAKKSQVISKLKQYLGVPSKEQGIKMSVSEYKTIYKYRVSDLTDTAYNEETANVTVDLYTMQPMQMGQKYLINYYIVPHPTKHQKMVAVATKIEAMDAMSGFVLDKKLLAPFVMSGKIEERLETLFQSTKHYIAKHLNFNLWLMNDLVFNSILRFNYNGLIRGALDVAIIGDTQVGKSETASKLTMLYDFGHFLSLKTSTTLGLLGGSNKVDGSFVNTIGAIPRQHQKLVVLEEFSGAKPDFIKTMTEVRSSGFLHFARVAGETRVPCLLRMVTVSNPVADEDGQPRAISTFPNGVEIVLQLIKSAEDVARYDGFMLVEKPKTRVNPFHQKLVGEPIPQESYKHKAQWVYSRKPEHVVFEKGVEAYIWDKAEELNDMFECNFPIFGTTTNLKLARFSVALASLLMNTDETMEKVIVTKSIVDYMFKFLVSNYDNNTFKLREYKNEFESYAKVDSKDTKKLQELYVKNTVVLEFLEQNSRTSRMNLRTLSGLETDPFSTLFNTLVRHKFIKISGDNVTPTMKFRETMKKIDRSFTATTATLIQ